MFNNYFNQNGSQKICFISTKSNKKGCFYVEAKRKAEIAAKEKAKQDAEEAKEKARREAEETKKAKEAEEVKHLEGYLKEVESTYEELKAGKIEAEEAIQRLRDISERIPK